ncbi:hypothetical protein Tco_0455842 [Tanacetum coccineum]
MKELVLYQGFSMSPKSSLLPQVKEPGSKQVSEYSEEDQLGDKEKDDKDDNADDEGDNYISDNQDVDDDEDAETEFDEDEIYKYKIHVRKDEDVDMSNAKVEDSDKGDEEVTNAAKADAEKTSEVKDDAKKTELPPTSSNLSISSGFGDQFLKLSSDSSLVSTVKDTIDVEINSLLEVKIQSEVPHIQSPSMLRVPVSVISEPSVLTPVQESPLIATVTTLHPPSVSTTPPLRVAKLEKDVFELKKIDLSVEALAALKTQFPSVVDNYLGSKVGDLPKKQTPTVDLEQDSEKSPSEILKIKKEQAKKQKMLKFTIKSTDKAALKELYHALIEALIEDENAMDKGVADIIKDHKRKHDDNEDDDDEDPPAGPNQGKKTKNRRTKDSESSKKPSTTKEIPKDMVRDDDQPQDASEPKTTKTPNPEWFTIKLEYHFQECFNALTDRLDRNNPEGDRYPFDMSKPLPLQGHPSHLTVAADYFFNNDL